MAEHTYVPDGRFSWTNWSVSGASTHWEATDEGIASADDGSSYVLIDSGNINDLVLWFTSTHTTPADFQTPTNVEVKIRGQYVVNDNDEYFINNWAVYSPNAGGNIAVDLTNLQFAAASTWETLSSSDTSPSGSKADWDDCRIVITPGFFKTAMQDATTELYITTIDAILTYTPTGGGGDAVKDCILSFGIIPFSR